MDYVQKHDFCVLRLLQLIFFKLSSLDSASILSWSLVVWTPARMLYASISARNHVLR
jgi:hypothetical protein